MKKLISLLLAFSMLTQVAIAEWNAVEMKVALSKSPFGSGTSSGVQEHFVGPAEIALMGCMIGGTIIGGLTFANLVGWALWPENNPFHIPSNHTSAWSNNKTDAPKLTNIQLNVLRGMSAGELAKWGWEKVKLPDTGGISFARISGKSFSGANMQAAFSKIGVLKTGNFSMRFGL